MPGGFSYGDYLRVGVIEPDANDVTLHGARLLLRRALQSDRGALAAILSEPEVVRWWGPYDPDTALDEIDISFVIVVDG